MSEPRQHPLHPFEARLAASWPPEDWKDVTVLAAVSGGGDSVALLRGLEAIKMPGDGRLIAAHVNHKLRGDSSDTDQRFVEELCCARGIACEVLTAAVDVTAGGHGQGIEAAARRARYTALEDLAGRLGARFIVTAHTADDQVETILHRILRGTGIRGLAGMTRARQIGAVTLLRPLLTLRRSEATAYLSDLEQPFCTDASNLDSRFTRNRIRNELLPLLARDYNQSIADALLRLGDLAGESQSLIETVVETIAARCVQAAGQGRACLDARLLASQPPHLVREVLLHVWRGQGWPLAAMGFDEWATLTAMLAAATQGGPESRQKRMFPGEVTAEICDGQLLLFKA